MATLPIMTVGRCVLYRRDIHIPISPVAFRRLLTFRLQITLSISELSSHPRRLILCMTPCLHSNLLYLLLLYCPMIRMKQQTPTSLVKISHGLQYGTNTVNNQCQITLAAGHTDKTDIPAPNQVCAFRGELPFQQIRRGQRRLPPPPPVKGHPGLSTFQITLMHQPSGQSTSHTIT